MNIFIANDSGQKLGGGWTFIRNFLGGLPGGCKIVESIYLADVVFIPAASMVDPSTLRDAEDLKKPVVLRIDNIPRNSRNRNTGTSRLKAYHDQAKAVIYQSNWAQQYIGTWLDPMDKKPSQIIWNGVDMEIFNPHGPKIEVHNKHIYLFSRFNRDETKNWHEAWYHFQLDAIKDPKAELWLVGQFSSELVEYGFDFFRGERVHYWGVQEDPTQYAKIIRGAQTAYFPYYNDACSNTLIEALSCGIEVDFCESGFTGGAPEILKGFENNYDFSQQHMARAYVGVFNSVI